MRKNQSSIQTQAVKQVFSLKLLIIFILISLGLLNDTSAQDSLQVKGFGPDRNSAIINALKLGIQQRYGVAISAKSEVHNFVLKEDKIMSLSKGYAARFKIDQEGQMQDEYFVVLKIKFEHVSDLSALLRSTIMPGWGQYYKGRTTKAWIFALSEVVMLSTSLYTDYKADEMYDKSLNTSSQYNRDWYYDKHLEYQKVRNISIAVTSAGWIYNMLDAFISVPILGQRIETKTSSTISTDYHAIQIRFFDEQQNFPAIQLLYSF